MTVTSGNTRETQYQSEFSRLIKVFFRRKLAMIGLVIITLLIITAIFAPLISPYNPYSLDIGHKLSQPGTAHLLGTDSLGRDILSRIIYGSRTSLLIGIFAVALAVVVGQSLGLIAGYFGGIWSTVIMRCIDALMSVPMILSAVVVAMVLGSGMRNVIIALSITMIPTQSRLMYSQVLSLKQNDYIMAERAMGASNLRIMFKHIVLNAFPPLLVLMTIELGTCILAEAGLSFLGVGIPSPTVTWGGMVSDGYKFVQSFPILSFAPGLAIMLVVFGFNMVGDGLRDVLDPRLRGLL